MTASKLSPPSLHWSNVGPDGDTCDLCSAQIKPDGDCFLSIRRAFELIEGWMVETEPIRVLMCVDCGWTRPYAPVPREGDGAWRPERAAGASQHAGRGVGRGTRLLRRGCNG